MKEETGLKIWIETVSKQMPQLSKTQAMGLALWSFGMVVTKSCGLTTVSIFVATLLDKKENTTRQRLREWYKDAEDKAGTHREAIEVKSCFGPLVGWVLSWWTAGEKRLGLVMDASTLGQKFTVLAIRLSRLCHSGGLGYRVSYSQRRMEKALVGVVEAVRGQRPSRLDGNRDGRSGLVCQMALPSYRQEGVASVSADQKRGKLSS